MHLSGVFSCTCRWLGQGVRDDGGVDGGDIGVIFGSDKMDLRGTNLDPVSVAELRWVCPVGTSPSLPGRESTQTWKNRHWLQLCLELGARLYP